MIRVRSWRKACVESPSLERARRGVGEMRKWILVLGCVAGMWLAGDALAKDGAGWHTNSGSPGYDPTKVAAYYSAYNQVNFYYGYNTYTSGVRGNSDDNLLMLRRSGGYFPWSPSTTGITATNQIRSSLDGSLSSLSASMNVTDVSPYIPEPSTLVLMGTGPIGIALATRSRPASWTK